jgi:hypothetical protein
MPTIKATYRVSLKTDLEISRDFHLNREYQLARALYEQLMSMEEDAAVDFLLESIVGVDEGQPARPEAAS